MPETEVLNNEQEPEGEQDLAQVVVKEAVQKEPLHEDAEHGEGPSAKEKGKPEVFDLAEDRDRYVGPQDVEGAVSQVEDSHQSENES